MWMCIIIAIYKQDPFMGTASVDKGGALNVLGAVRDSRLPLSCYYILFYVVLVDGSRGGKKSKISIDRSFCWIYSVTM